MAISMENSPLHDLPPGTHLYFDPGYAEALRHGGLVSGRNPHVESFEVVIDADGDLVALSVPERMVNDWYEANWELGAMHCSGEDFDGEAQAY